MERRGEFELIGDLFAPLAADSPASLDLRDDAALLKPEHGREIVATTDALVAGVHFRDADSADLVGRKLLRVSLSDLAAMGSEPFAYLLTVVLPSNIEESWLEGFVDGLAQDQDEFGIRLVGGDTVSTDGPMVLSLTALGSVPEGQALRRSGACAGDDVWVSGTIGDAALGLRGSHSDLPGVGEAGRLALADRYLVPRPRVALGTALRGLAHACIDVSDGLVADFGHVCRESGVRGRLLFDRIPLSEHARAALEVDHTLREAILSGGDDYELLFTAAVQSRDGVLRIAEDIGIEVTRFGQTEAGGGVAIFDADDSEIVITSPGYTHF